MKKKILCFTLASSMLLGNANMVFAAPPIDNTIGIKIGEITVGNGGTNITATKAAGTPYTNEERVLPSDKHKVSDDTTLPNGWEWATPEQELTETFADTVAIYKVDGIEKNRVTVKIKKMSVIDDTAPTGEIKIGTNIWNAFLNFITFGLLFNETQSVEVTANDDISGVDTIEYYVSNTAMTLDSVKAITNWTLYKSAFDLTPDNQYVVYVKITDKAGNVSYISTDGIKIESVKGELDTEVKVSEGTPKVEAKGLENVISEEEKKQVDNGEISVDVALAVDKVEKSQAEGAAAIDEVASGAGLEVDMYLDLSLTKTTTQLKGDNKEGKSKEEDVSNTNTALIEVVVPYDSKDKSVMLYRYSKGNVTALTKLSGANSSGIYTDGDFYVDESGNIHIFTTQLGTLAIALESEKSEHIHSYTSKVTKEATCEENGEMTYTCEECGDSYTEVIPALGHNYTSKVTVQPTSKSEGIRTYTCERCGESYTEIIAKLPAEETTEATTSSSRRSSGGGGSGKASDKASEKTGTAKNETNKTAVENTGNTDKTDNTDSSTKNAVETYKGFADVKGLWCEKTVNELHEKGIVNGRMATLFAPNENLTRAELVQLLANMKGIDLSAYKNKTSKFADVSKNAWYYAAVAWAEENNIVYGVSADNFAPENNISREDTAAIIYRYMGISADTNAKAFSDSASISGYAKEAVGTLSSKGIINGYPDNSFKPKNTVTRAETASILYNIAE